MVSNSTDAREKVAVLFKVTEQVIDSTLTSVYGIPSDDAAQLELELFAWFDRFARRPGTPDSLISLRPHLLSMACKIAHVYWSGRADASLVGDERVRRSLALGPEVVASEIEERLQRGSSEMSDQ